MKSTKILRILCEQRTENKIISKLNLYKKNPKQNSIPFLTAFTQTKTHFHSTKKKKKKQTEYKSKRIVSFYQNYDQHR